jgi:hypothetical protein
MEAGAVSNIRRRPTKQLEGWMKIDTNAPTRRATTRSAAED